MDCLLQETMQVCFSSPIPSPICSISLLRSILFICLPFISHDPHHIHSSWIKHIWTLCNYMEEEMELLKGHPCLFCSNMELDFAILFTSWPMHYNHPSRLGLTWYFSYLSIFALSTYCDLLYYRTKLCFRLKCIRATPGQTIVSTIPSLLFFSCSLLCLPIYFIIYYDNWATSDIPKSEINKFLDDMAAIKATRT